MRFLAILQGLLLLACDVSLNETSTSLESASAVFAGIESVTVTNSRSFEVKWQPLADTGDGAIEYEVYVGKTSILSTVEDLHQLVLSTSPDYQEVSNQNFELRTIDHSASFLEIMKTAAVGAVENVSAMNVSLNLALDDLYFAMVCAKVAGEYREMDNQSKLIIFGLDQQYFAGITDFKISSGGEGLELSWGGADSQTNPLTGLFKVYSWSPVSESFLEFIENEFSEPLKVVQASSGTQNARVSWYSIQNVDWLPETNGEKIESLVGKSSYQLTQKLALDKSHAFQVVKDPSPDSGVKNVVVVQLLSQPLAGFSGLKSAEIRSESSVLLAWDLASNVEVSGYKIYRGNQFKEFVTQVAADQSSYLLENLSITAKETFGVKAVDAFGHQDSNNALMVVDFASYAAVETPILAVSPSNYDFGSVKVGGDAATKMLTITNQGGATTLGDYSLEQPGVYSLLQDNCSGSLLEKGASCTMSVSFKPVNLGVLNSNAIVKFVANDAQNTGLYSWAEFSFTLKGTGVANIGDFAGVVSVSNVDRTRADLTWVNDSLASSYVVYRVVNGVRSEMATVSAPATGVTVAGLTENTSYQLQVFAKDSLGLEAQNNASVSFTTLEEAGLLVQRLVADDQYKFIWENATIPSGSTFTLTKKSGSTPPDSVVALETVFSGVAATETSYTSAILVGGSGDIVPVSFTLFHCAGSCTPAHQVTLDGSLTSFFLDSIGPLFKTIFDSSGGLAARIGWAETKDTLLAWNGLDPTDGVAEIVVGGSDCADSSSAGCTVDFSSLSPWTKRYFRISVPSSDRKGTSLSEMIIYAKVPDGMVYVDRDAWPVQDGLEYEDYEKFSFAIDKYELVSETYLSTDDGTPASNETWSTFNAACGARIASDYTGANAWRKFHLPTGVEFVVAAYGTPENETQGYCNLTSRGSPARADATGTNDTSGCLSYFGARNMIGNLGEWQAEILDNRNWKLFYNTADVEVLTVPVINETSGESVLQDWDRFNGMPSWGKRLGPWTSPLSYVSQSWGTSDATPTGSQAQAYYAGLSYDSAGKASIYTKYLRDPNSGDAQIGGRCSLVAPEPGRVQFQNDSDGSGANFRWRLWAESGVSTLRIGIAKAASDLTAWDGAATGASLSDSLYVVENFSECTNSSYNSEQLEVLGNGSTTSGVFGMQGRCGIDMSSLNPWEKRYVKLFVQNSIGSVFSTTHHVARVPDGMVFIDADDWPDLSKHIDAKEYGESYTSPFDFAVDKYKPSANGTVSNCASEDFPCSDGAGIGGGFLESKPAVPLNDLTWYTYKAGCDARTGVLGVSWADTSASPGVSTGRRVHLATGLEWTVASFGTPGNAIGPQLCNTERTFYDIGGWTADESTTEMQLCQSRYGVRSMVGNQSEWVNDIAHNGDYIRFFDGSTGVDVGLSASWSPGAGAVLTWDWDKAVPLSTTATYAEAFHKADYAQGPPATSGSWTSEYRVPHRGGVSGSWSLGPQSGRFYFYMWNAPNHDYPNISGRCALRPPP